MTNLTDIWALMQKAKSFDFDIIGFINENLGVVMSVSKRNANTFVNEKTLCLLMTREPTPPF